MKKKYKAIARFIIFSGNIVSHPLGLSFKLIGVNSLENFKLPKLWGHREFILILAPPTQGVHFVGEPETCAVESRGLDGSNGLDALRSPAGKQNEVPRMELRAVPERSKDGQNDSSKSKSEATRFSSHMDKCFPLFLFFSLNLQWECICKFLILFIFLFCFPNQVFGQLLLQLVGWRMQSAFSATSTS